MEKEKKAYGLGWIYKQTKGSRAHLVLLTVLVLFATGLQISLAYFLKLFIDIATGELDASLLFVGLLALAVVGGGGVFFMLISALSKYIYGKTERRLRTEMMKTVFTRRYADISKEHTGDLLTKLTIDIQAVSECFPKIIENMVGGAASALAATVMMFFLNWKMALIMLILTPLLLAVMGIVTPFIQKASLKDKENEERNRSLMQEALGRIILIKAFFMNRKIAGKVHATYAEKLRSGVKLGFLEGLALFSGMFVSMGMFLIALGIGAYFVMQGETTFGNLIAIVQLLNYIVNPVANFAGTISQVSQATASSGRMGEILQLPPDTLAEGPVPVDAVELIAEDLSFSYGEDGGLLKNISASFEKGNVTGVAGKSGCGKSTLLKLLIGLYESKSGNISLNHTAGSLGSREIMAQTAYVPPSDYLFSGTVAENIVMNEDSPRLSEMRDAASGANILDFIDSLPEGFDTEIGEGGGTVSSGQAQRIAIARAIYKRSPVIIFDEPTANLDAVSIEKFQTTVKSLAAGKIVIIVTHDLSTMTVCDKVYILEGGSLRAKRDDEEPGPDE
jgi:ABC-type bacteriocin/lantibiotic exporter with double-glycine peptidase domain